jgi:hypothetical protein
MYFFFGYLIGIATFMPLSKYVNEIKIARVSSQSYQKGYKDALAGHAPDVTIVYDESDK